MGVESAALMAMLPSMAEVGTGLSGLMGSFGGGGLLGGLGELGSGLGSILGLSGEGGLLGGLGGLGGIGNILGEGLLGAISGGGPGAAQGIMSALPSFSAPSLGQAAPAMASMPEMGSIGTKAANAAADSGVLLPSTKSGFGMPQVPPAPSFGEKLAKSAAQQFLSQGMSSLLGGPQRGGSMPQISTPNLSSFMTPPMTFSGRPTSVSDYYGVPRMPQSRGYF